MKAPAPKTPSASTLSVLIVEDTSSMRQLLEHLIGSLEGARVSGSAKNSQEARIELTRRRPDLVLLDEVLPGESSLDLLAETRKLGLPVLLITGLEDSRHPVPEGARGRLFKPSWETLDEDRKRFQAALDAFRSNC